MATFISDQQIAHLSTNVNYLEYATLTGDVSRSGNTVTLSNLVVSMRISRAYSAYGETQNIYIATSQYGSAISQTGVFTYNFSDGPNHTESHGLGNASISVGTSDTSATLWLRADYNEDAQIPFTVTFPSGATAPTGLGISGISATATTVTATVSVTGWGGAGDANSRYRNLSVCAVAENHNTRRYQRVYGNTLSSAIEVNNSTQYGSMTIEPNTRYWLWWYATNGTYGSEGPTPSTTPVVTLAQAPTITNTAVTTTTATFSYATSADGGYYDKQIQYSLDNGTTWITAATVTGSSASSGTFTISNLLSGASYTMKTRVITTAGSTVGADVTFATTAAPQSKNRLYGSVNSLAELVHDFYGSANSQAQRIAKLYGPVNEQTKLIHQGFGHFDYGYGVVTYYTDADRVDTDAVYLSSQSEVVQLSRGYGSTPVQSWNAVIGGVTIPNDRIKEVMLTEKVTTLNGSTVYQCFLANCAYVTKVDLSRTKLTAVADEGYFCWRNRRLKQLYLPDTVTSIGNGFCIGAGTDTTPAFSPSLVLPSRLVTIGNNFLGGADTFNQDLSLPQTLTSIGTSFLGNMRYMTGVVNVGSLSADIIAADEKSFYSSYGDPAYSTGISIAGSTRAAWLAKFPNSSSSPYYRKLVDAGY